MSEYKKRFFEILSDDSYGICPAPTDEKLALQVLVDYLLGEDWFVVMPLANDQITTCAVHEILNKYSRKYRKDIKKARKKSGRSLSFGVRFYSILSRSQI